MKTANNYMTFTVLYMVAHHIFILFSEFEVPENSINYFYYKLVNISRSGEH